MSRPTELRRSVISETIRRLRLALGETQQQFAVRLGMSAITIAKYETNKRPSPQALQHLVDVAVAEGRPQEAQILQNAINQIDPASVEAKKRFLLNAAFQEFLEQADAARLRQLERLLSRELNSIALRLKPFWGPNETEAILRAQLSTKHGNHGNADDLFAVTKKAQ